MLFQPEKGLPFTRMAIWQYPKKIDLLNHALRIALDIPE
jgi:hypothetical protein